MALSHFSSTKATSLASGMTSNATAVYLVDGSTYPDPAVPGNGQYTIIIGYGSDREEVCTVIAKPGANQLTVTRGQDGSAAVSKNIGDVVVHGVSARDFNTLLSADGGTMTGYLTLSGAPASDLHAATKKYVDDLIALASPVGIIAPFGQSTAVSGWLLCNGQSTSGYPALAAMYGATVPDLRDKFVLGDGGALPNTGGSATVPLVTANMPSHSHGGSTASGNAAHGHTASTGAAGSHSHGFNEWGNSAGGTYVVNGSDWYYNQFYTSTDAAGSHSHTVTVDSASASHAHTINAEGSGTAHENMPPYYALTFQVRAG